MTGVSLENSSNNRVYHNNFINNTKQVHDVSWDFPWIPPSINIWDDGYPSGGNYWSDYTGVDEKSGPNQDQPGSDGIGDTPYVIDVNNRDGYPLMSPFPWTKAPIADFTWTPPLPSVGQTVIFDASASKPNGGVIVSYEWDFGDGTFGSGMIVAHTYNAPGTYTVTLRVKDSECKSDIKQRPIQIVAAFVDIVIVNITFSKGYPMVNETIQIYVTVLNNGTITKTFDVSVNYTLLADPLIGTQTITLEPKATVTLNFTWTPTESGRYEIKAYTSPIPDDVNQENNTKTTYIYIGTSGSSGTGQHYIYIA